MLHGFSLGQEVVRDEAPRGGYHLHKRHPEGGNEQNDGEERQSQDEEEDEEERQGQGQLFVAGF